MVKLVKGFRRGLWLGCVLAVAVFAAAIQRDRKDARCVRALQKFDARLHVSEPYPWYVRKLPYPIYRYFWPSYERSIVTIDLNTQRNRAPRFDDDDLRDLASFPRLQELILPGSHISDNGARYLTQFKELKELGLAGSPITDAGMKAIGTMSDLEGLLITSPRVTDVGISDLSRLKKLRALGLQGTQITDESIDVFKQMTSLKFLNVSGTRISRGGANSLNRLLPGANVIPTANDEDF